MNKDDTLITLTKIAKELGIKNQTMYARVRNGYAKWKPQDLKILDKYGGLESIVENYNSHIILFRKKCRVRTRVAKILNIAPDTADEKFSGKRRFFDGELKLLAKNLTKEEKELFGEIRYERRNSRQIHN